jgi:hypothetical protein
VSKKDETKKKKSDALRSPEARKEAKALVWTHRRSLALGLGLMVISRLAGLNLACATA